MWRRSKEAQNEEVNLQFIVRGLKFTVHNLQIIKQIERLHEHGCAIVLGVSRKRFIGSITDTKNPQDRLPGSLAAAVYARTKGVQIFRVHDVLESKQALLICDYIQSA